MDEKSHFYLENQQRSKKAILAIFVLSILVIAIPITTYLASQKTDFLPSASEGEQPVALAEPGIFDKPSVTLRSSQKTLAANNELGLDVVIDSKDQKVNLALVTLNFPKDVLQVSNIATSSAALQTSSNEQNDWIGSEFDNTSGKISLLVGLPKNQTENQNQRLIARVFLKPIKSGVVTISVSEPSALFSNSDNKNILINKNNFTIQISGNIEDFSSLINTSETVPTTSGAPPIQLLSPQGGEVVAFYQPKTISWQKETLPQVTAISLFLNNQFFGNIVTTLATDETHFEWNPSKTLLSFYATDENVFQIRVTGRNKDGKEIDQFSGPFSLTLSSVGKQLDFATALPELLQLFKQPDNTIAVAKTISQFISNYGVVKSTNKQYDINQDGQISKIDLWFARQFLVSEGTVK